MIHENSHLKFHKCYEILFFIYYIRNFSKTLKIYLKHCSKCQINEIKQHKSYETLQLIDSSSISFHTVTMNFILILSKIKKKFNCVMSVTCKFFKKIILIFERSEWIAKKWIKTFFFKLDIMDWGFFKQIISDRNRKLLRGTMLERKKMIDLSFSSKEEGYTIC